MQVLINTIITPKACVLFRYYYKKWTVRLASVLGPHIYDRETLLRCKDSSIIFMLMIYNMMGWVQGWIVDNY